MKTTNFRESIWMKLVAFTLVLAVLFYGTPVQADNIQGLDRTVAEDGTVVFTTSAYTEVWIDGSDSRLPNFNQAAGQNWRFDLAGGNLSVLVGDGNLTTWAGSTLITNGILGIFNLAGIHFTNTAHIEMQSASLIAAQASYAETDSNFTSLLFHGKDGLGSYVLNEGIIEGGDVALLGRAVENRGTISAPLGRIFIAGADWATVGLSGDNLVSIAVDSNVSVNGTVSDFSNNALTDQIKNTGFISAKNIEMTSTAYGTVFAHAINLAGLTQAKGVRTASDGSIEFVANLDIVNSATIDTPDLDVTAKGFTSSGTLTGGRGDFNTTDRNIFLSGTLGMDVYAKDDITINGAITLSDDVIVRADADSGAGGYDGTFNMTSGSSFDGTAQRYDLSLTFESSGSASELEDFTRIGALSFHHWRTLVVINSNPGEDLMDVADFSIENGMQLNRFLGSGTQIDPYLVGDVFGMQLLENYETGYGLYFKLTADMDLANVTLRPLGRNYLTGTAFGHSIDGDNHRLSNLNMTYTAPRGGYTSTGSGGEVSYLADGGGGLLGYFAGTIENLYLDNVVIRGVEDVGGLVGINAGIIRNVHVTGSVIGTDDALGGKVGGLVGRNAGGSIYNSSFVGTVEGFDNVGGLVGDMFGGGRIENSHAIASVVGRDQVGGLVGDVFNAGANIETSYSRGTVLGQNRVGGFAGQIRNGARVDQSYSSSDVIGSQRVGGFFGVMESQANAPSLSDSYSVGNVSGFSDAGLFGGKYTGGTINRVYARGAFSSTSGNNNFISNVSMNNPADITQAYWAIKNATQSSGMDFVDYFDSFINSNSFYNSSYVEKKTDAEMKQQTAFQTFNFSSIWNIDAGSSTPYLRALGKHPESNAGTPSVRAGSAFALDVLNNVNYDRVIFPNVFGANAPLAPGGGTRPGEKTDTFGRNSNLKTLPFDGSRGGKHDLSTIFDSLGKGGGMRVNQVAAGQTNFKVDASSLNLGDAISLAELQDVVFGTEVKSSEKRVVENPTTTKVEEVNGDVRVVSKSGEVYAAKKGMELGEGDQIWTASGAKAELNVKNGEGKVLVGEKSAVSLKQEKSTAEVGKAAVVKDLLTIALGSVSVQMASASSASSFAVQAPTGISGNRG